MITKDELLVQIKYIEDANHELAKHCCQPDEWIALEDLISNTNNLKKAIQARIE